jgi:hypothetical protein
VLNPAPTPTEAGVPLELPKPVEVRETLAVELPQVLLRVAVFAPVEAGLAFTVTVHPPERGIEVVPQPSLTMLKSVALVSEGALQVAVPNPLFVKTTSLV